MSASTASAIRRQRSLAPHGRSRTTPSRQGLGQPRREAPEFLQPSRDHPAAIEHRPEPSADRAMFEAAMNGGVEVIARDRAVLMGRVPAGDEEPLQPRRRLGMRKTLDNLRLRDSDFCRRDPRRMIHLEESADPVVSRMPMVESASPNPPAGASPPPRFSRVYRAVSEAEYLQIQGTGAFEVVPTFCGRQAFRRYPGRGTSPWRGAPRPRILSRRRSGCAGRCAEPFQRSNLDGKGPARFLHIEDLEGIQPR